MALWCEPPKGGRLNVLVVGEPGQRWTAAALGAYRPEPDIGVSLDRRQHDGGQERRYQDREGRSCWDQCPTKVRQIVCAMLGIDPPIVLVSRSRAVLIVTVLVISLTLVLLRLPVVMPRVLVVVAAMVMVGVSTVMMAMARGVASIVMVAQRLAAAAGQTGLAVPDHALRTVAVVLVVVKVVKQRQQGRRPQHQRRGDPAASPQLAPHMPAGATPKST